MDLMTADYTFVNERLARHYGIPNVYGSQFRRITLTPTKRGAGLLGQASILTVTSYPNRTSPVQRGKWILTNLLGTPPTPPPPNVPPLKENGEGSRAEIAARAHGSAPRRCRLRRLPQSNGPDRLLAREFRCRRAAGGLPTTACPSIHPARSSTGAKIDGAVALRNMLTAQPEVFVGVMTEKLLTYALGRGVEYYDMPAVRKIVRTMPAPRLPFFVAGARES